MLSRIESERERATCDRILTLMKNQMVGAANTTRILRVLHTQKYLPVAEFINRYNLVHEATKLNLPDLVRKLVQIPEVDINKRIGAKKNTPLHVAVLYKYCPLIRILMQNQADHTIENHHNMAPLDLCASDAQVKKFLEWEIQKKLNLYNKFRDLKSEFAALGLSKSEMEAENARMNASIFAVQEKLDVSTETVRTQSAEITLLESSVAKLQCAAGQDGEGVSGFEEHMLLKSVVLTEEEKINMILGLLYKMVARNKKVRTDVRKLKRRVILATREMESAITTASDLEKVFVKTKEEVQEEKVSLQTERTTLEEELASITGQNQQLAQKVHAAEEERNQIAAEIRVHVRKMASLQHGHNTLQGAIKKREQHLQSLEGDVAEATRRKSQLEEAHENLKNLPDVSGPTSSSAPQRVLARQARQLEQLRQKIADEKTRRGQVQKRIEELGQQLQEKNSRIRESLGRTENFQSGAQKELASLRDQLAEVQNRVDDLKLAKAQAVLDKTKLLKQFSLEREQLNIDLQKEQRVNQKWAGKLAMLQRIRDEHELEHKKRSGSANSRQQKSRRSFEMRRRKRQQERMRRSMDAGKARSPSSPQSASAATAATIEGEEPLDGNGIENSSPSSGRKSLSLARKQLDHLRGRLSIAFEENVALAQVSEDKRIEMIGLQARALEADEINREYDAKIKESLGGLQKQCDRTRARNEDLSERLRQAQGRIRLARSHRRNTDLQTRKAMTNRIKDIMSNHDEQIGERMQRLRGRERY